MPHAAAVGVASFFFTLIAERKSPKKKAGETETETVARATPLERQLNVVAFICYTLLYVFISILFFDLIEFFTLSVSFFFIYILARKTVNKHAGKEEEEVRAR